MIEKQPHGKYKRYFSKKPKKTLKNKKMRSTEAIGLWGIFDAFSGSDQPIYSRALCGDVVDDGLCAIGFFLSANRGSFKMLVGKEVTAGFTFRIVEDRTVAREAGDRFLMAADPAREQWTLR